MANTYLERTSWGTPTNTYKATFSAWIKRGTLTSNNERILCARASSANTGEIALQTSNELRIYQYVGAEQINVKTNRMFRDTSAWYHIVVAFDTTQGTSTDRIKVYVNGVQETSFANTTYPSQNETLAINNSLNPTRIGTSSTASDTFFTGSMSHIHFIDGTAYDASAFGETDATTGEWKAKTSPSVTYGTNGFFILKDGNGITDQSGEGNDFTLGGGTLTDLKDNPDNTFATWNPLVITSTGGVAVRTPGFQNSNTTALFDDSGNNEFALSSLAPSKGKYYAEFKWVNATGNGSSSVGIVKADFILQTDINDQGVVYKGDGNKVVNNSNSSYGASWTTGDIIAIVLDCDSNTVNFYKNNAAQGSISIDADTDWYMFCSSYALSSVTRSVNANFGNGYFGTTAITTNSGNGYAGAEGASKFNYTVPTGYSALSTKGLNE